ncbi:hypothetical protein SSS_05625 [Sarcoptes scabiei]|nr:hypothetical protein SSS_05625 [Sarcoptes scabiei]
METLISATGSALNAPNHVVITTQIEDSKVVNEEQTKYEDSDELQEEFKQVFEVIFDHFKQTFEDLLDENDHKELGKNLSRMNNKSTKILSKFSSLKTKLKESLDRRSIKAKQQKIDIKLANDHKSFDEIIENMKFLIQDSEEIERLNEEILEKTALKKMVKDELFVINSMLARLDQESGLSDLKRKLLELKSNT